jgi:hypothetical protein
MKRQLKEECNAKGNKKVKGDNLPNNDYYNKTTTSKPLAEAEKKELHAEYTKMYRQRITEQHQKLQQQHQVDVTLNKTSNRPKTSQA